MTTTPMTTTPMTSAPVADLGGVARSATPAASRTDVRAAGIAALGGAALSVVGSVLNQVIADVDVFAAMQTASPTEQARLLTDVAGAQTPLVAGFMVWMIAFPMVAAASVLLAGLGRQTPLTAVIRQSATASMGAILVFLSMFITFVVAIAPAHVAGEDVSTLARAIGFTATTTDWLVTAIVLGFAPAAAVYAGRGVWAPRWLQGLAALTVAATIVELVALVTDERDFAFPLVPIGLLLVACAGISAIRHADS